MTVGKSTTNGSAQQQRPTLREAVARLAPGTALRDGLERILRGRTGALIVLGYDDSVEAICDGGFSLDVRYAPTRLRELCKMDGAVVLSTDGSRILRANVQLVPDPSIPTDESGTRHRSAERAASQTGYPVISVSHSMSIVTVYLSGERHVLADSATILSRANQASALAAARAPGDGRVPRSQDRPRVPRLLQPLRRRRWARRSGSARTPCSPRGGQPLALETADGLVLVGELALPVDADPVATMLCLHPLPTHGGMMDSHLFRKAAFRLPALADIAVLRFNTRGTKSMQGTSQGEFSGGEAERHDVVAALEYAEFEDLPNIWVVGWSFGSDLALRHAHDPAVAGAILLSPPLRTATDADLDRWAAVRQAAGRDRPGARRLPASRRGAGAVRTRPRRGGRRTRRQAPLGRRRGDRTRPDRRATQPVGRAAAAVLGRSDGGRPGAHRQLTDVWVAGGRSAGWLLQLEMESQRVVQLRHGVGRDSPENRAQPLDGDRADLLGLCLGVAR